MPVPSIRGATADPDRGGRSPSCGGPGLAPLPGYLVLAQGPAAPLTWSEAGSVLAPRWQLRGLGKRAKFALKGQPCQVFKRCPALWSPEPFLQGTVTWGEGTLAQARTAIGSTATCCPQNRRAEGFLFSCFLY